MSMSKGFGKQRICGELRGLKQVCLTRAKCTLMQNEKEEVDFISAQFLSSQPDVLIPALIII
jgi:hypothetical protein